MKFLLFFHLSQFGRVKAETLDLFHHPSEVVAQLDNLVQQEVDVLVLRGGVRQHASEEVHLGSQRLVANHSRAFLHHPGFYLRSQLQRQKEIKVFKTSKCPDDLSSL